MRSQPGGAGGGRGGRGDRLVRIAEQLRQELSSMMLTEMKDERVRFATVSEVRPSRDLRTARVLISATGTDTERAAVIVGLRHAEGFLRSQLGQRLENLKWAPRLHFELDQSIAYAVHVSSVLRNLAPEGHGKGADGADAGTDQEDTP